MRGSSMGCAAFRDVMPQFHHLPADQRSWAFWRHSGLRPAGGQDIFGEMVDIIESLNALLGALQYIPNHGAGLSGFLFPP